MSLINKIMTCSISIAALMLPASALSQESFKLRVADYLPPGHLIFSNGIDVFMQEVREKSGGRIDFEYFPGGQLGKATDMLDMVQSGAVDIALIVPSYTPEKFPVSTIIELPGLFTDACSGTESFIEATRAGHPIGDEFAGSNVRPVISFMYQPADLLTVRPPVTTVADWSGMKIRVTGGPTEIAAISMGAVPIKLAVVDMYQALSRGTVDATLLVATSAKAYGLDTLVKSITTGFSLGSLSSNYIMGEASWNRLPPDLQAIVEEAGVKSGMSICAALDSLQKEELERMAGLGITVTTLTDEQNAEWKTRTGNVLTEWATRIGLSEEQARDIYVSVEPGAE